jgi:hypothetical protein
VQKDRAAPFSKKHRRYWIPVTGGMIFIGLLNVVIGFCVYQKPSDKHEQIQLNLIKRDAGVDALNTISPSELPAEVMRAFAVKYPQTLPAGATVIHGAYVVQFPPGKSHVTATFKPDGTFVSEQ